MAVPLPKWLMQRYSELWLAFRTREFEHEQAAKILKKEKLISPVLSALKRYGWLTLKLHPIDSRKRIYQLKSPEEIVDEISRKNENKK